MIFDFKITDWIRVYVPKEHERFISDQIEQGDIVSHKDIISYMKKVDPDNLKNVRCERLEFNDFLSIEDNYFEPTIEIRKDNIVVFDNSQNKLE